MKKLFKFAGWGLGGFITVGTIALLTACGGKKTTTKEATTNIRYDIAKKEAGRDHLEYRIVIDDRLPKESLIEIARQLKQETGWKEKLVCFFNIKAYSPSGAWASVAYLPNCSDCATDKDGDGNPVKFYQIGLSKGYADSLQQLTLDTISNKQLLASYIDDGGQCKTFLYTVDNNPSRILLAYLYSTSSQQLQWLDLRQVNDEKRYYFKEEEPGEELYIVFDESAKQLHYKNETGKILKTYGYE